MGLIALTGTSWWPLTITRMCAVNQGDLLAGVRPLCCHGLTSS